ncbi:DUF4926 domain-containing protein [Kineococcus sp. SYSU DK005]|uniref:DUF4926 domain-containing protein n=1 Tax=Kineococcus sp. SYSU DK005 TaxID=3383126 RepID=UPI003D7DAE20
MQAPVPVRFSLLDVVVLTEGVPGAGVPAGAVGTVVHVPDPSSTHCEVEVADDGGRTLWWGPVAHADLAPHRPCGPGGS